MTSSFNFGHCYPKYYKTAIKTHLWIKAHVGKRPYNRKVQNFDVHLNVLMYWFIAILWMYVGWYKCKETKTSKVYPGFFEQLNFNYSHMKNERNLSLNCPLTDLVRILLACCMFVSIWEQASHTFGAFCHDVSLCRCASFFRIPNVWGSQSWYLICLSPHKQLRALKVSSAIDPAVFLTSKSNMNGRGVITSLRFTYSHVPRISRAL